MFSYMFVFEFIPSKVIAKENVYSLFILHGFIKIITVYKFVFVAVCSLCEHIEILIL